MVLWHNYSFYNQYTAGNTSRSQMQQFELSRLPYSLPQIIDQLFHEVEEKRGIHHCNKS